jgi:hypothetical protein
MKFGFEGGPAKKKENTGISQLEQTEAALRSMADKLPARDHVLEAANDEDAAIGDIKVPEWIDKRGIRFALDKIQPPNAANDNNALEIAA